jgi:hypothetical protein
MKLIFEKDTNNEINVKLQNGEVTQNFTYIEMVKQLLLNKNFDDTDFGNLSKDEQGKIKNMLEKISDVFEEKEENGLNS